MPGLLVLVAVLGAALAWVSWVPFFLPSHRTQDVVWVSWVPSFLPSFSRTQEEGGRCSYSPWSKWSFCSAECGRRGHRARFRTVRKGRMSVCRRRTMQVEPCTGTCTTPRRLCSYEKTVAWSPCSRKCGRGVQRRTRLLVDFWNLSKCDAAKHDVRPCNNGPCPIDCRVSDWVPASNCSAECGRGSQLFVRNVLQKARFGGACDFVLAERRLCDGVDCPVDCLLSDWERKTACNATCGAGFEVWSRTVLSEAVNGGDCNGPLEEVRECAAPPCPKPCVISEWIAAEPCDCTVNIQKWIRLYTDGDCLDDKRELSKFVPCKCDCRYGIVGDWSSCCNRTQSRTLSSPLNESEDCPLSKIETRPCNGTCVAECAAKTVAGCTMGCPWCPNATSWSDLYHNATSLLFFRPLDAGVIARPQVGGRGRTRVFTNFKLLPGERVTAECSEDIHAVRQIVSHNNEPYRICDGRFSSGNTYLVSGLCENGTFYIAPCGISFVTKS